MNRRAGAPATWPWLQACLAREGSLPFAARISDPDGMRRVRCKAAERIALSFDPIGAVMDERPAARLLVLNAEDRLLLFQFVFVDGPLAGDAYWATPGGRVESGETFKQAARRELLEETGIDTDVGTEIGRRHAVFKLPSGDLVRADERYFCVRVEDDTINDDGQQTLERQYIRRYRWWSLDDLRTTSDTIYPEELFDLLDNVPQSSERSGRQFSAGSAATGRG